jgi:hypothetical protein
MSVRFCALTIFFTSFFLGCDKGLEPPPPAPTISGKIYFSGAKPPCDSIRILAVVLIEAAPPYVPETLINGFLSSSILTFVLESCTFRDTTYKLTVAPNKRYNYLGVTQNYDTNLYNDWRIVGFAHMQDDSARSFELMPGEAVRNVDIHVRFDSLPRQPFAK